MSDDKPEPPTTEQQSTKTDRDSKRVATWVEENWVKWIEQGEIREMLQTRLPWLRFQVGHMHVRPLQDPIYTTMPRSVCGYRNLKATCSVFQIDGWGDTLEKAQARAAKAHAAK